MLKVIIESPYGSSDPAVVEENVRFLRACMRDSLLRGEAPYASHALYTQPGVLDDQVPEERKHGIDAGFAWRAAADKTVFYLDRPFSNGMLFGWKHVREIGHPFEFRFLDKTSSGALAWEDLKAFHGDDTSLDAFFPKMLDDTVAIGLHLGFANKEMEAARHRLALLQRTVEGSSLE